MSVVVKGKQAAVTGLVPRLRFPEFSSVGDWGLLSLSSVLNFQVGFPFKSSEFTGAKRGLRLVRNRDLRSNDGKIYYTGDYDANYIVNDGDVLIGMDGDFTPSRWKGGTALLNQRVGRVVSKRAGDLSFLFYVLCVHLPRIELAKAKTTVKHLSHSDVERIKSPMPCGDEQQKIADCLSSLDERIAAETRRLDALKAHKQGLLQQLFPHENETVPRARLAQPSGEWLATRLNKIATVVRGGSPRPIDAYLTAASNGHRWLKIGDLDKNAKYVENTAEWIKSAGLSKTREIHPGDLILSNSMSFGRPYISKIDACIHDGWLAITEISPAVTSEFLYYFLRSPTCQAYFRDSAAGSGVRNLNVDLLDAMPISYPALAEQQKIADCLTSIDDLIAAQGKKVALLKQHKRGLMQQLFPVPDEAAA